MWDERYDVDEYLYGKEPNDFLVASAGRIPGKEVLCLAEGEGRNAVWLAEQGCRVTAVDASAVGLRKATALARERGVSLRTVVADLARFALAPEGWDAIVSIFCHVPSALRRDLHHRVVAGLRPGGLFLLEGYTPRQLQFGTGGPPDPDKLMELASLKQELEGLEWLHAVETEREIHEGTLHRGRSAVVQILAIKP